MIFVLRKEQRHRVPEPLVIFSYDFYSGNECAEALLEIPTPAQSLCFKQYLVLLGVAQRGEHRHGTGEIFRARAMIVLLLASDQSAKPACLHGNFQETNTLGSAKFVRGTKHPIAFTQPRRRQLAQPLGGVANKRHASFLACL